MKFNTLLIVHILGLLLILNGMFMWLCLPLSIYYADGGSQALMLSGGFSFLLGVLFWVSTRAAEKKELKKRDGYFIVTAGWLIMSCAGTLPYLLSGTILNFHDAFFETISGYSTTGASILTDIEAVPKGILLWRSLTQWMGGMGIIVLTVAILPILGIGGMQLFVAEAPGLSPDKLQPRIKETAKRLWYIYLGLTFLEIVLLALGGMEFFDALNHGLTTMATGGFSTKNASIAAYPSPFIQYTIIFFMLLAGTNFTILYFILNRKFKKAKKNEEFITYISMCLGIAVVVAILLYALHQYSVEKAFRTALFQVVSIITTTGFVTEDFSIWSPLLLFLFFTLMFIGGSSGSTAGGVKLVRHIVLAKNSMLELKRQMHPNAVMPVRLNGRAISQSITFNILAFIIIYILIFALGSLVLTSVDVDFKTAIGAVATCLGNIGPGIGKVGPVHNFSHLPELAKWFLTLIMLLGRLELFTVLILFTPYFWRKFAT